MSKNEYIQELRGRIAHLPVEEQDAALTYYFEYLEELGEENIDRAIRELGTPREVAERIIADYTQRMAAGETRTSSARENNGCLVAALMIMASPLLVALAAVVLSLVLVAGILMFIPLLIGVVFFFAGIWALFVHFGTGLALLGGSLISTGIFCVIFALLSCFVEFILRIFNNKREDKRRRKAQAGYGRSSYFGYSNNYSGPNYSSNNYSSASYSNTNNKTNDSHYSQTKPLEEQSPFTQNRNNPIEPPSNLTE